MDPLETSFVARRVKTGILLVAAAPLLLSVTAAFADQQWVQVFADPPATSTTTVIDAGSIVRKADRVELWVKTSERDPPPTALYDQVLLHEVLDCSAHAYRFSQIVTTSNAELVHTEYPSPRAWHRALPHTLNGAIYAKVCDEGLGRR